MKVVKGIYRGDTPMIYFLVKKNGVPFDFRGGELRFCGKRGIGEKEKVFDYLVNPLEEVGRGWVQLSSRDTERAGSLVAELEYREGEKVLTIQQFILIIQPDIRD